MATQSLYRRYRPRRFSEVKGQDHVVKALRNAVANGRQGHAYLFSGPRGTGKTSTARILAKVLNCENPQDGEPCCECASCLSVEAGNSFDVHELDAASNNGVEAMRELIDKAMLGTPGRHKVYILDEVHMLSKGAEGALLKTLEEPPPHVVFVLATTDPQRVSETITSRTQAFQFHLLAMDVMEQHIRWLAKDAHLEVNDAAIDAVLRQGGGSARDTISSLEVVLAGGGIVPEQTPLDEFIESLIESDSGRALAAVAASVLQGRDVRVLTESLVAHLRDCFLSLMAPELVALPGLRADEVGVLAERLGAPAAVKAIETLGTILVEMRHAPDPRVLLEVALVKLTNPAVDSAIADLTARLAKLERAVAGGANPAQPAIGSPAPSQQSSAGPNARMPPSDRAVLGSRARRDPTLPPSRSQVDPIPPDERLVVPSPLEPSTGPLAEAAAAPNPVSASRESSGPDQRSPGDNERLMSAALAPLRVPVKALYGNGELLGVTDGVATFAFPSEGQRKRGEESRAQVEASITDVVGSSVKLVLTVGASTTPSLDNDGFSVAPAASPAVPQDDADIDLDDLVDAPSGPVMSPIERIAAAFPGVTLEDES